MADLVTGAVAAGLRSPTQQAEARNSFWQDGFIASPAYDLFFFILSPLLALTIILSLDTTNSGWAMGTTTLFGQESQLLPFFISTWTWAHLSAVFFRSHANKVVFKRFWPRFVVAPVLLFLVVFASPLALSVGFVIAGFWDVYHSSMQNFSFCRIYDAKLGNSPDQGRRLDIWINLLAYAGPIFVGLCLHTHLFKLAVLLNSNDWNKIPIVKYVIGAQAEITLGIVIGGGIFLAYYCYAYWKMSREGYRVSPQKILLIGSTAVGCTWAWAFLPPLEAYFTANFFHALQYFAIVWWTERQTLTRTLGLPRVAWGPAVALAVFLLTVASVGVWYEVVAKSGLQWAASLALVISLLHFWYDGFIWSVRKQQI